MSAELPRETDNAFLGKSVKGGSHEPTYAGALSFMRRCYSRDLTGIDLAVWGIPFDASVSNRPGARFGPQGVRRASAIFDGDPQYADIVDGKLYLNFNEDIQSDWNADRENFITQADDNWPNVLN